MYLLGVIYGAVISAIVVVVLETYSITTYIVVSLIFDVVIWGLLYYFFKLRIRTILMGFLGSWVARGVGIGIHLYWEYSKARTVVVNNANGLNDDRPNVTVEEID